jgi:hypothetical protein
VVEPKDERGADIRDRTKPIEVWWHGEKTPQWRKLDLEDGLAVPWRGAGDLDAALLRCKDGYPIDVWWPGFVTANPPVDRMDWVSAGFPHGGDHDGIVEFSSFSGEMFGTLDGRSTFEIQVLAGNPKQNEDWSGASGMPIFFGGTNLISGIAVNIQSKFEKKLHAAPAYLMRRDAKFVEVLGDQGVVGRNNFFREELTYQLDDDETAKILKRAIRLKRHLPDERVASPDGLADALLGMGLAGALEAISAALGDIDRTTRRRPSQAQSDAAIRLTSAALVVCPALHDPGVVGAIAVRTGGKSDMVCGLPATLPIVAEIIMAGAGQRPAEFHPMSNDTDFPVGVRQLPEPPECGIGGAKEKRKAIEDALLRKMVPGSWAEVREDIYGYLTKRFLSTNNAQPNNRAFNIERINAALEAQTNRLGRFYIPFLLPADRPDGGVGFKNFSDIRKDIYDGLRELQNTFPSLMIIGLMDDARLQTEQMKPLEHLKAALMVRTLSR